MTAYGSYDARQRVPAVGDTVAYNQSGNIAVGVLVRIGHTRTGGPIYYIEQTHPSPLPPARLSRVRGGAWCVLVLKESA